MLKSVLSVLLICLIISCATTWDWEANPYTYDAATHSIINAEGDFCKLDSNCMDGFVSFPYENIQALEENIERLDLQDDYERVILQEVEKLYGVGHD